MRNKPSKKQVEFNYIEEARRASPIFPAGQLTFHERPDFLINTDQGILGIEVTELCREGSRAEAGRLSKVPCAAKLLYNRLPGTLPVDVGCAFSPMASEIGFNKLRDSLVDFVAYHGPSGSFEDELPDGFCCIGIHTPFSDPSGRWWASRAFDVVPAPKSLIESRIAEKNQRVSAYRIAAPRVWLLIINDKFLGPGEVVCSDELTSWTFAFDFDEVLILIRQPGGGGQVIPLRRT